MAAKSRLASVLFVILAFFLVSCFVTDAISGLGGRGAADDNGKPVDVYRSEAGGYSFKPRAGYEMEESFGITSMLPPGVDPETGLILAMFGGSVDEEKDNDTLLESMKISMPEGEFSKAKKVKVDGKPGLQVDIEEKGEVTVQGRMIVVMVSPNQEFVFLGAAPEDEWKSTSKDFDKILKSVRFFTPAEIIIEDTGTEPEGLVTEPEVGIVEPPSTSQPVEPIRQWAISAVASSQYAEEGWSAKQATGEANVEGCEDDVFAWASLNANTVEWIELTYATPVLPMEITIVQNYNPGQVVEVTGIGENGTEYLIWEGEPEYVDYCPDYHTITFEPYEEFYIDKIRITIDQSVLGMGWNEIDAVELVGMPQGAPAAVVQPVAPVEPPAPSGGTGSTEDIPEGKGFLATEAYLKYLSIPVNTVTDLEPIIGPLVSSTSQLKPRADHKDTYMFDIGGDMTSYTRVTTSGLIYWKDIGGVQQVDMGIEFDSSTYDTLKKMCSDAGYKLPYTDMANFLGSPGMVTRHYLEDDGRINIDYKWYNSKGDSLSVYTYDGIITGTPTFIPKQ